LLLVFIKSIDIDTRPDEDHDNGSNSVLFKLFLVFFEYLCHIIPIRYFQIIIYFADAPALLKGEI